MNDNLFHAAIRTLAEIDTVLGLPDDGCNSPARTLQALHRIKKAHEQIAHWTEQFQRAMKRAEQAEARAAELEKLLQWSVKYDGECLGDHPHILGTFKAALASRPAKGGQG